jgi:hypothetical protein
MEVEEEDVINYEAVDAFERKVETFSSSAHSTAPSVVSVDISAPSLTAEVESLRRQLEEEKQRRAKLNAELLRARNGSSSTSSGISAEIKQELEALRRSHQMRMEESNITGRLLDAKDEALAIAARAAQDAEFQNECLRGDVEELKAKLATLKGLSSKTTSEAAEEDDDDDDDDDSMLVPPTPPAQGLSKKALNKASPAVLALLEEKNKLEQELVVIENRHEQILEKLENENDGLRRDRNSLRKERDALRSELDSVKEERDSLKNALLGAVHRGNDTAKSRDEFIAKAVAEARREVESELIETRHLLEEASAFGRALLVANKELEKQNIMYQSELKASVISIPPSASKQPPLPSMETLLSPKAPPLPPTPTPSLLSSSSSSSSSSTPSITFTSTDPFQPTPAPLSSSKIRQGTSESSLKDLTDAINATLVTLSSPQPSRPPSVLPIPQTFSATFSMSSPRFTLPSSSPLVTSASRPPLFASTSSSGSMSSTLDNGQDYLARRMLMEARGVEERERARRKIAEEEIEQLKRAITGKSR